MVMPDLMYAYLQLMMPTADRPPMSHFRCSGRLCPTALSLAHQNQVWIALYAGRTFLITHYYKVLAPPVRRPSMGHSPCFGTQWPTASQWMSTQTPTSRRFHQVRCTFRSYSMHAHRCRAGDHSPNATSALVAVEIAKQKLRDAIQHLQGSTDRSSPTRDEKRDLLMRSMATLEEAFASVPAQQQMGDFFHPKPFRSGAP
jgi:hypothetical protein